jgi:uncharacterized membrane protein YeaQ/YmgE (transglycosylase-associated protein family)
VDLAFILSLLVGGLVIGALARLAVPGPDPMPIWLTIALGLAGSLLGGLAAYWLFGSGGGFLAAIFGAMALLIAHRKLVQKRPLSGPRAKR